MPAILKGWMERIFTCGFACSLKPEGWKGDLKGRVPLFKHEKALLIITTLFDEQVYKELIHRHFTQEQKNHSFFVLIYLDLSIRVIYKLSEFLYDMYIIDLNS